MRGWDRVTPWSHLRPGPAGVIVLLAGLLLSLAPVSQRLENAWYDFVHAWAARTAPGDVVVIDTHKLRAASGSTWENEAFPQLLERISQAGTRLVLIAETPPDTTALPDAAQLETLAEVERRSRESQPAVHSRDFADQVAQLRRRASHHEHSLAAVAHLGNLVLAVPATPGERTAGPTSPACARFPRMPISESLCSAVRAAGHVQFQPDADGIVRRMDLVVDSGGTLVPSAALSAALALGDEDGAEPAPRSGAVDWNDERIPASAGIEMLIGFYGADDPRGAFEVLAAEDLLKPGARISDLADRVVVVGDAGQDVGADLRTPSGTPISITLLLATSLSNLMQDDNIARPAWFALIEKLLLIGIGVVVLAGSSRLTSTQAAVGGLIAALVLLGTEAAALTTGVWMQLATAAVFLLCAVGTLRLLQAKPAPAPAAPGEAPIVVPPAAGPQPAAAPAPGHENELDLAFSMLRHQAPNEHVKKRLYDLALEHARQRDLAKAERVLRHLAGIDPDYRSAGEKLKKLGGLRAATANPFRDTGASLIAATAPPAPVAENLSGRTIGRYQIEQPIGRGAMATVYLGRDPKINRRVAIKTIALAEEFSENDLDNARAQFLREAESAGRLNHPNIVSIYDAGEDGSVAYLAMEYFPGKSLSEYAQLGKLLPTGQVLEIVARAADALNYAHNQHVVHRDIKPANLLYDATTDTLKITDFGIARLTDSSRTKTGIVLGTPSYMSPEQLSGAPVNGQSDLFSLGISLYQLLTGAPPFRADSIPRLMQKIAHEPHAPISQVRDDLPPELDAIIDRALAKDPADRFPNGRAMALALRDCCSRLRTLAAVQQA